MMAHIKRAVHAAPGRALRSDSGALLGSRSSSWSFRGSSGGSTLWPPELLGGTGQDSWEMQVSRR